MSITKWLVEKVQKLVQVCKNYRSDRQIEKWYSTLTDEELRQWINPATDDQLPEKEHRQPIDLEEELRKCEESQALAKAWIEKKSEAEALENERAEELYYEELANEWPCQDCGEFGSKCTCTPDDDDHTLEVPQMGLPCHEEEEIPLWLEHANEECPNCGLLPEFCQCQYEE
ncbi:MAG: hypothetical protein Q8P52_00540 [bacterium]|nr:hypothetical protein [bacterium]